MVIFDLEKEVGRYGVNDDGYTTLDKGCERVKEILTDHQYRQKYSVMDNISQVLKECVKGDEVARKQLLEEIKRIINTLGIKVKGFDSETLAQKIYNKNWGLDIIQDVLDDPETEEVYFNDYDEGYRFKVGAVKEKLDIKFENRDHMMTVIERMTHNNRDGPASFARPIVSCDMKNNLRVKVTIPPVASTPTFNIRKLQTIPVTTEYLVGNGTFTQIESLLLKLLVRSFCNIVVTGPTNSGKSLLTKYLVKLADPRDRIVVVEKRKEFNLKQFLPGRDIVEYQEVKSLNHLMPEIFEITLQSSPDRIIVPEALGTEIREVIAAAHRGHEGLLTSFHERDPHQVVKSMAKIYPSAEKRTLFEKEIELADKIDIIIQMKNYKTEQKRRVAVISEVYFDEDAGKVQYNDLVRYDQKKGQYKYRGLKSLKLMQKIDNCLFNRMIEDDITPLKDIGVIP